VQPLGLSLTNVISAVSHLFSHTDIEETRDRVLKSTFCQRTVGWVRPPARHSMNSVKATAPTEIFLTSPESSVF
jgi:hypothetical protein